MTATSEPTTATGPSVMYWAVDEVSDDGYYRRTHWNASAWNEHAPILDPQAHALCKFVSRNQAGLLLLQRR
jgi:hypothetical protein